MHQAETESLNASVKVGVCVFFKWHRRALEGYPCFASELRRTCNVSEDGYYPPSQCRMTTHCGMTTPLVIRCRLAFFMTTPRSYVACCLYATCRHYDQEGGHTLQVGLTRGGHTLQVGHFCDHPPGHTLQVGGHTTIGGYSS